MGGEAGRWSVRALAFRWGCFALGLWRLYFVFGDFAVSILIKLGDGVACALDLGDGNFPVSISIQHLK